MDLYGWYSQNINRRCNTSATYLRAVTAWVGHFFLDHLSSARTVKVIGSKHAPLGYFMGIQLPADKMPLLEHFELSNVVIDLSTIRFIASSSSKGSLRSIVLRGAAAHGDKDQMIQTHLTWSEFFNLLVRFGAKLDRFELDTIARRTDEEELGPPMEPAAAQELAELVAMHDAPENRDSRNGRRRLFGYSSIDITGNLKYGTWLFNKEKTMASFEAGDDQKAYDAFMETVGKKRTKVGSSR